MEDTLIYGVLITYDDMPHIQKTIESIYDKVDCIVVIDGRFKDFPGEQPFSTDGTIEFLEGLEKVTLVYRSGLTEVEKRNEYLIGNIGDWYLHLDADESWKGDIKIPNADMLVHYLEVKEARNRRYPTMPRIRLFRHVDGLHYEGKHYWLKDGDGDTFALLAKPGDKYKAEYSKQVKVIHHEFTRTPERRSKKQQYYRVLYKFENKIRERT